MKKTIVIRHSRESGNPVLPWFLVLKGMLWIPAFAGMTIVTALSAIVRAQSSALPGITETPKTSAAPTSEPAKSPAKGHAGEFVIKGEGGLILDSSKPELTAAPNDQEPLKSTLLPERQLFLINPPDFNRMREAVPTELNSDYVIRPRHFHFHPDAVAYEFNLAKELGRIYKEPNAKAAERLSRWEFKVADASGKPFAQFSGKGLPPESLQIPTRNASGEEVRPGNPYAGVLTYRDTLGEVHTAITQPFVLYGLTESSSKGYTLHLALSFVFEQKEVLSLTPMGTALIQETADWIKARNMALAPLYITVFGKKPGQAQSQAEILAQELSRLLLRKMDNIHPKGSQQDGSLDEHIEISVFLPKDLKR